MLPTVAYPMLLWVPDRCAAWQWQFWYEERMRELFLLSGAANRLRNFHLSRAWERWQASPLPPHTPSTPSVARTCASAPSHNLLSPLLGRQEWYEDMLRQQQNAYVCSGAIRRMMNRKLSMAWEQWQWYHAQMKAPLPPPKAHAVV